MKKGYKFFIFLYIFMIGFVLLNSDNLAQYASALEYVACGSANGIPKPIPQFITIANTLLTVGAPLVLIIFAIVTLIKATTSGNSDNVTKAKDKLFKKFLIAGVIFLTGSIVQFVISRVTTNSNDSKSLTDCLSCFLYYNGTDEGDNCQKSDSGNNVTDATNSNAYSNLAEPTTSNRKGKITGSYVPSRGKFKWPLPSPYGENAVHNSKWGCRMHPIQHVCKPHTGVDIGVDAGVPIYAAADGTVNIAGWSGGYGNLVTIDHGDGYTTYYAHQSKVAVKSGDRVRAGQLIGYVGSTGNSTGPHLHFEVRLNGKSTNPMDYFIVSAEKAAPTMDKGCEGCGL